MREPGGGISGTVENSHVFRVLMRAHPKTKLLTCRILGARRQKLLDAAWLTAITQLLAISLVDWSQSVDIKTTYSDGSSKTEKSNDIIDFMFGHILLPIIGRLIIAPLIIAAFIYYPLMCIVWLVGAIFPYVLAAIVLGIIILSWALGNMFQLNNQGIVLAIAGILFTAGFAYGGYAIEQGVPPTFEQQPVSTSSQNAGDCQVTESEFEDSEINEDEFE